MHQEANIAQRKRNRKLGDVEEGEIARRVRQVTVIETSHGANTVRGADLVRVAQAISGR